MAEKTPRKPGTKVVLLTPERMLERAARRFLAERSATCVKCGSAFVDHEPAFIHCRYCGAMMRIANRPLAAQEEFELRSGLRVAS
jgi:hypothetical protein